MTHPESTQPTSRLDPERVPRRDFLGLAALWSSLAAGFVALLGILRLPKAAVLPAPSRKFRVEVPESLAPGVPFEPAGRNVTLFRDQQGSVYAISKVCTHLGCIVRTDPAGFHCPCHGSNFDSLGEVLKGPAPAPLAWFAVQRASDGTWIVNEGQTVPQGTKEG